MDITEQAKGIMDQFFEALQQADLPESELGYERDHALREPEMQQTDDVFVKTLLDNAPKVKDNCIDRKSVV